MGKPYLRNNIWYSDYWFAGRRVRKPLSPNRRDAQIMQDEMSAANRFRKHGLVPQELSWKVFKTQYLRIRKSDNRPNTYAHDDLAFRRLDEVAAVRNLIDVTPELLEQAKLRWKEKGYGDCAIGSYTMRIKVAMKTAEAWRYAPAQPWRIVKDHSSPGRVIYYTIEQFEKCIHLVLAEWASALLLMARAGLRSGEVRHLEWGDIDFEDRLIHIHPKPHWKPKGWKPGKPCERYVDMPDDLFSYLKSKQRKEGLAMGRKISEGVYARYFKKLISAAGLRGSAHAFRHTYASWLISNGCSLEEVGDLLGHTNPITTKMYAHLMPHARKRAVKRLPPFVSNLCRSFPPSEE